MIALFFPKGHYHHVFQANPNQDTWLPQVERKVKFMLQKLNVAICVLKNKDTGARIERPGQGPSELRMSIWGAHSGRMGGGKLEHKAC